MPKRRIGDALTNVPMIWILIDPPGKVAAILLSRAGLWRVPSVLGVITAPTLRRDGSIVSAAGYDPVTRLFHMPNSNLTIPNIPERPTRIDAEKALSLLSDLLVEFPFCGPVDRTVALSGLISPAVRGALGSVPLHGYTAPSPGTGKSYLVDVGSAITTGRFCPVVTAGKSEEEMEKRLGGLLLAGFSEISIDNVSHRLGGDLLCQAVERPLILVRPLGKSDIIEVESHANIYANGNNLVVEGDMVRRTVLCRLDARMERPEERMFTFDPVQRVLADRGRYLAAALTITKAYLAAGCPNQLPPIASFSAWSGLVRSTLVWLGCSDPIDSMREARNTDPELTTLRTVLECWRVVFREGSRTAQQVASLVSLFDPFAVEGEALMALRAALAPVAAIRGIIDAAKLGYWLRTSKERPAGGYKFDTWGETRGVARWGVLPV